MQFSSVPYMHVFLNARIVQTTFSACLRAFLQDHAALPEQGAGKKARSSADALLQEGLAMFQRLGNRWGIVQAFSTSGRMIAARGNQSEAYRFYKQTLELALETYVFY